MNQYLLRLKIVLQSNFIYYLIGIIVFLFILFRFFIIGYDSKIDNGEKVYEGIITNIKYSNSNYKLTVKGKIKESVIVYYYSKDLIDFKLGDYVSFNGTFSLPKSNTIPNLFNYKKYLNNHKIYYLFNADSYYIKEKNKSLLFMIKNYIIQKCNSYKYGNYLKTFIIGDKSDIDEYDTYQANGVAHLFAISGMHIGLLSSVILFFTKKFKYRYLLVIIFLILYLFVSNYSVSILRSVLFFIILRFNNYFDLNISIKKCLLLTLYLILFLNPLSIFDLSFQYSFVISYGLISCKYLYKKNYFYNIFITSIISFVFSLGISVYYNYEFNIFTIINNIIVVPLISFVIYPLSLLTFVFSFLSPMFNFFIDLLNLINDNLLIYNIVIPKVNILLYFIYYLLLFIFIKSNRFSYLLLAVLFIFSLKFKNILHNNYYINFLDVGQNDAILINYKDNGILIDTGGNYKYDISKNLIKYFKSIGINKISTMIISHGDFDHMGEAINLVENFKIENVIFNCGEYNELEQELIKVLDKNKIKYFSCIKELNIDKYKLEFLNTKKYDNENDNSNVIYFNYNNYKFLFMGDAGIKKEKDILDKYDLKDIDFLKVGHHGSNTSSSEYFINSIHPKYSVISVGKNNRYGHPKDEVLDTLKNSTIYRTDLDGSIEIKLNKNGYKIRTCPP